MMHHPFLRVAAAVPSLRVADCAFNAQRLLGLMAQAEAERVAVLVFPELSITGYTCADLFHQEMLQRAAVAELGRIAQASVFSGLAVVGLPLVVDDQLFNCAAVLHGGEILGIVPKSFVPNYKEFYERRWFTPAATARSREFLINGKAVRFGTDQLFAATHSALSTQREQVPALARAACSEGLLIGVEICEDLWVPIPPSSFQALSGATLLLNLSASNETIGKPAYRRQLVLNQSARCMAAYVYASCGVDESTTDVVFGGHCLIAENGLLLAESRRFQRTESLTVADVDLDRLRADRIRTNSFGDSQLTVHVKREFVRVPFMLNAAGLGALTQPRSPTDLRREVDAHPFVPRGHEQLRERCEDIFQTQVAGLARRLERIGKPPVAIGISGGLDSTLALLVACKTMDALAVPRDCIRAFTMPGFGTTSRTKGNAQVLMRELGTTPAEVDIRVLCLDEMKTLGHRPFGIDLGGLDVEGLSQAFLRLPKEKCDDLIFENVQARMRTSILMNSGFVIGTSDVSELALGWTTYNGDHMSMYNPNVSIPKTLVKFLVEWAARNEFDGEARRILLDIVATTISPELLPTDGDGQAAQETEKVIGPYELHDFFLFHFLRYGTSPEKLLFLAEHARFDRPYAPEELRHWLRLFVQRFFAYQFKRSCLPDGPKVGSISLSPRGDWRMPSDAQAELWLRWAEAGAK